MGMPDISGVVKSMQGMQEMLPDLADKLDALLAHTEREADAAVRSAVALENIAELLLQQGKR